MTADGPQDMKQEPFDSARPVIDALLEPECWPVPAWFSSRSDGAGPRQPKASEPVPERPGRRNTCRVTPLSRGSKPRRTGRVRSYAALVRHGLRTRYVELEAVFRGFVGPFRTSRYIDETTAVQIAEHLHRARELLEQDKPDVYMASDTLDLVEQYMVWVTPDEYKDIILFTLETRMESLPEEDRSRYGQELQRLRERNGDWESYRALVDHVTGLLSQKAKADLINRGLQVRRLQALRNWGIAVLAAFLLATPLAANRTTETRVPGVSNDVLAVGLTGVAVALVSAAAGYLSGLLQVRERRVDLVQYQTSVLKLQLRPIVGGIVSVALFVLLSWNIVPGVQIDSRGSLFLVAFLAGFSERYFLRLLEIRPDDGREQSGAEERQQSGAEIKATG